MTTLAELEFTREELLDRCADKALKRLMTTGSSDDEGAWYERESQFALELKAVVSDRINEAVNAIADKHIQPNLQSYIEGIVFQKTNEYGEKKGEPMTFVEYLAGRAEEYMTEKVNYSGKSKSPGDYGWSGTQTRLTHMIHEHLHCSIETAMKTAVKELNGTLSKALSETCITKLNEVAASLKVAVTTK